MTVLERYQNVAKKVTKALEDALGFIGQITAQFPIAVILGVSLFCLALASGFLVRFKYVGTVQDLWLPQGSESVQQLKYIADVEFPTPNGFAEATSEMLDFYELVTQLEMTKEIEISDSQSAEKGSKHSNQTMSYKDLCFQNAEGECAAVGYLGLWGYNRDEFQKKVGISKGNLLSGSTVKFEKNVNKRLYSDGSEVLQDRIFGKMQLDAEKNIVGATAVSQKLYQVQNDVTDEHLKEWYNQVEDLIEETRGRYGSIRVRLLHTQTIEKALGQTVENEIKLVVIVIVLVCTLAVLVLCKIDLVESQGTLGVVGAICVALALASSYGLGLYVGIPLTLLSQVLPFILLGIGIDDVFVIVQSLNEVDEANPADKNDPSKLVSRISQAMHIGGVSISVTSITDVAAFLFGSATSIPAIQWFCWQAALAITFTWLIQVTVFVGFLVLSERRRLSGRLDLFCCFQSSRYPNRYQMSNTPSKRVSQTNIEDPAPAPQQQQVIVDYYNMNSPQPNKDGANSGAKQRRDSDTSSSNYSETAKNDQTIPSGLHKLNSLKLTNSTFGNQIRQLSNGSNEKGNKYMAMYTNLLVNNNGFKVLILLGFAIAFGVGIFGVTQLKEGLPLQHLAPKDHYVQKYFTAQDNAFTDNQGNNVDLYFRNLDQSKPKVQALMQEARIASFASKFISPELTPKRFWLQDFVEYVDSTSPDSIEVHDGFKTVANKDFNRLIALFFSNAKNQIWFRDIVMVDDQGINMAAHAQQAKVGIITQFDLYQKALNMSIVTSRFPLALTPKEHVSGYERKVLQDVRQTEDQLRSTVFKDVKDWWFIDTRDKDSNVFIFDTWFITYESDARMPKELAFNLGLALIGTLVVNLVLMVHPIPAVLMAVAVLLVDALLIAEMWLVGIRFNSVAVVNLVMAVGLAVDYSVHIAHKFMSVQGATRNQRVTTAVATIGPAVALGAFTTIIGALPLAFAKSSLFKTFFALIFGTGTSGLVVGLVFVPIALSIVGPEPAFSHGQIKSS